MEIVKTCLFMVGLCSVIVSGALLGMGIVLAVRDYRDDRDAERRMERLLRAEVEDMQVAALDAVWELPARDPRETA